ncbi:dTMP kinase [Mechercharimyces sp. CAU 1602]|uniref:dTMP kinase n=1 Tax=Mechercharimyces sp. CAU 1602 TaxID=2973933 RepID=UPI002161BB1E|nr:dTMP kinase [Mechercharimyces sp. CAU 1602]MCS1352355.1 dTMP kinase [Mechercharimyces sp. CAU 1602]
MSGLFITLEGPEGAGKSTQISRLYERICKQGWTCTVTREPGGTALGDRIRRLLLDPESGEMAARTEILLYAASRAQLVEQVIQPALERGEIVLCDRYLDSSIAYQGYGLQCNLSEVRTVNMMATGGLLPQRTYLLDVTAEESEERLVQRGNASDRIEQREKAFHERVRHGFLYMAQHEPKRYQILSGKLPVEDVTNSIWTDLVRLHQQLEAEEGDR